MKKSEKLAQYLNVNQCIEIVNMYTFMSFLMRTITTPTHPPPSFSNPFHATYDVSLRSNSLSNLDVLLFEISERNLSRHLSRIKVNCWRFFNNINYIYVTAEICH
jgi:hypothetical protein